MSLPVVRSLRRVKQLRADRAEQEMRRARALAVQAEGAVAEAKRRLAEWIEEMPRRSAALYDEVLGTQLDRDGLEALNRRVVALSEHRQLLEHRVKEAEKALQEARAAAAKAEAHFAAAQRAVSKFDELIEVLRKAAVLEAERKEDSELEEAAETRRREAADGEDWAQDGEDAGELDRAA
jgi:type III secretion protein O